MLQIRPANVDDVPLLRSMIRELAEFERQLESCVIEESTLARDGFGPEPRFRALIGEWESHPAAYAVFYAYYSTWEGHGLYLEDLFVRPQFRGKGIGVSLLQSVARVAVRENCCAMRWEVLDWNENAISLYKSLGAEFRDQWKSVLLGKSGVRRLAELAS